MEYGGHDKHLPHDNVHWELRQHAANRSEGFRVGQGPLQWRGSGYNYIDRGVWAWSQHTCPWRKEIAVSILDMEGSSRKGNLSKHNNHLIKGQALHIRSR